MFSMEKQRKPEIVVFAGPNGSGKSTYTKLLKPINMDYINADEIKKTVRCSDLDAAVFAEKQREEHLDNLEDFSFETVMSTDRNLNSLMMSLTSAMFVMYTITLEKHRFEYSRRESLSLFTIRQVDGRRIKSVILLK